MADLKFDTDGYLYIDSKKSNNKYYYGIDTTVTPIEDPLFLGSKADIEYNSLKHFITQDMISMTPQATNSIVYMPSSNNYIDILTGCESQHANKVSIHFVDATMQGLFSDSPDISVLNESSCDDAIDKISGALKKASEYRSYFGSIQNRLEHAYNINQNIVENTQFAESRIKDTDMASEMVNYSNKTILTQAGQSMLTQANQSNQNVLSLIA